MAEGGPNSIANFWPANNSSICCRNRPINSRSERPGPIQVENAGYDRIHAAIRVKSSELGFAMLWLARKSIQES